MDKYPSKHIDSQLIPLEQSTENSQPVAVEVSGEANQESTPVTPMSRSQILRLVRLGKNFDKAVKESPNAQRYYDEHQAVVRTVIRDGSLIDGRY